jgi:hypothetical protein
MLNSNLSERQKEAIRFIAKLNVKNRWKHFDEEDVAREEERIALSSDLTAKAVRDYEKLRLIKDYIAA